MSYPDDCLRGIPNSEFVADGKVRAHLFRFDDKNARQDGCITVSINWNDDNNAVPFTLNQKDQDGNIQFEEGVAIISRESIDDLNRFQVVLQIP